MEPIDWKKKQFTYMYKDKSMAKVIAMGKFPYISNSSLCQVNTRGQVHIYGRVRNHDQSPQICSSAHPWPSLYPESSPRAIKIIITPYTGDPGRKIKVRFCAASQIKKNSGISDLKPLFFLVNLFHKSGSSPLPLFLYFRCFNSPREAEEPNVYFLER